MQQNNSENEGQLSYFQYAKDSLEQGLNKKLRSRMLGTILIKKGIINSEKLEQALEQQKQSDERLGKILIQLGYATEEDILSCMAVQAGIPYISLEGYNINLKSARLLGREFAEKNSILIIDQIGDLMLAAVTEPMDQEGTVRLEQQMPGVKFNFYLTSPGEIAQQITEIYE
jgi:MshEN domain